MPASKFHFKPFSFLRHRPIPIRNNFETLQDQKMFIFPLKYTTAGYHIGNCQSNKDFVSAIYDFRIVIGSEKSKVLFPSCGQ